MRDEKNREKEWIFIVRKCIKYYLRKTAKISILFTLGLLIISSLICLKYKPLYKVTLNGQVIGYVENKEKLEEKISQFENNLEGNIISIKIQSRPEYSLELVSNVKESETKEDEVLALIKDEAEIKCKTYAIKLDGNEKANVNSLEEAQLIIEEIRNSVTEEVELNLEVEEQEKDKKKLTKKQRQ